MSENKEGRGVGKVNHLKQKGRIFFDKNDGRTQRHFKKSSNINSIMEKISKGGVVPINKISPLYGDFSNVKDLHEMMNIVNEAKMEFMKLPANVRHAFDNNPANLQESLVQVEEGNEELKKIFIELGLIESQEKPLKVGEKIKEAEEEKEAPGD